MKHIKRYLESTESNLIFDYKSKFNTIKDKYTKELKDLNEECRINIEESLLYILDTYESTLDKSYGSTNDMFNDFYMYPYKITLTSRDFLDRSTIIDNFKRAFEKLELNLGLTFPEDDANFDLDDIRFSAGLNGSATIFHCFKEFEEYILTKKITNKVNISLTIKP